MDAEARIATLEAALVALLCAVQKRSAWDYSDVLDEVFDAQYVLDQRERGAPPRTGAAAFDWRGVPWVEAPCPDCGAPLIAHRRQQQGGPLCPRYRLPSANE